MIRKLKMRFILLCMSALFALLVLLVAGMNLINYRSVVREADQILQLLSQNKGIFPKGMEQDRFGHGKPLPPEMSPELPYESRYFSVLFDADGRVVYVETSRIASVDTSLALEYAEGLLEKGKDRGFLEQFRFAATPENGGVRYTFLDCGRFLDSFHTFLYISLGIALTGFCIVFFVICFFAGRIIRPIAESYEKQKRFITDAGHEIKTPLTIINANVDVLEMELGQNECLEDIKLQTKRLTGLTSELVMLARMEEAESSMQMIEFPVSEVVEDAAMPFRTLAQTQGKEFHYTVQPMLSMKGNDRAIEQLISILMDNALKYSPEGGSISLMLGKQAKSLYLTVCNTTGSEVSGESLSHVFDRFYRGDPARTSDVGGHGIGLSVAKAIVTAHRGKIRAEKPEERLFRIVVSLPV